MNVLKNLEKFKEVLDLGFSYATGDYDEETPSSYEQQVFKQNDEYVYVLKEVYCYVTKTIRYSSKDINAIKKAANDQIDDEVIKKCIVIEYESDSKDEDIDIKKIIEYGVEIKEDK